MSDQSKFGKSRKSYDERVQFRRAKHKADCAAMKEAMTDIIDHEEMLFEIESGWFDDDCDDTYDYYLMQDYENEYDDYDYGSHYDDIYYELDRGYLDQT